MKRGFTADVDRLVKELSHKELPAEAPANEILARLAEVTTAFKRSKQGNVAVSASNEGTGGASPVISVKLGSVGAREEGRRQALGTGQHVPAPVRSHSPLRRRPIGRVKGLASYTEKKCLPDPQEWGSRAGTAMSASWP